jgi:hypothetical protein
MAVVATRYCLAIAESVSPSARDAAANSPNFRGYGAISPEMFGGPSGSRSTQFHREATNGTDQMVNTNSRKSVTKSRQR